MLNDTSATASVKGPALVPAVARAAALIDRIAATPQPESLSDLARALGLPKSSAHGLCQTLCHLGLLRPQGSGFALGPHLLRWAGAYLAGTDLVNEFHHTLAEDRRLVSHTVILSTLDGPEVVYLACRNGSVPLGISFRMGMRLPAIFTATGLAMLALLDDAAVTHHLADPWPQALTRSSVKNRRALTALLTETRKRGYALDEGMVRDGMTCLGVAIRDDQGRPRAGMAVSLTAAEATPTMRRQIGAALSALAEELARRI